MCPEFALCPSIFGDVGFVDSNLEFASVVNGSKGIEVCLVVGLVDILP